MPDTADRPAIAVLGAGRVGGTLAAGWQRAGHRVTLGVRAPAGAGDAGHAGPPDVPAQTVAAAVAGADVVVLAVPARALADLMAELGADAFAGKVLVDATNPMGGPPDGAKSGAAWIAAAAPGARVVKAFNSVGVEVMANPVVAGRPANLFIAGDDPAAVAVVADLARALGFEPIEVGGLGLAGEIEALARLWMTLARRGHGRRSAFAWTSEQA